MKYACRAATKGNARCRNLLDAPGFCAMHPQETAVLSDQPDVVLYKTNVNKKWSARMKELGVSLKQPDFEKREQQHVAHAIKHGRAPFRFRGKDQPADSGVPVFGQDGLTMVSLYDLLKELAETYNLVDIHLRPTKPGGNQNMEVLVVSFSEGDESNANTDAFQELLGFLASSCWGYCHVWANPPQDDGRVIHTVNSSHREDGKQPIQIVRFADGQWATEPVAQATT